LRGQWQYSTTVEGGQSGQFCYGLGRRGGLSDILYHVIPNEQGQ